MKSDVDRIFYFWCAVVLLMIGICGYINYSHPEWMNGRTSDDMGAP